MLVVAGIVAGAAATWSNEDGQVVATGTPDPAPGATGPTVAVERIEVVGDGRTGDGTTSVSFEFDGPLPSGDVDFISDITMLDQVDRLMYTTQKASEVHVCDAVHTFPPPAEGTVDLLIPADWFSEETRDRDQLNKAEYLDNPAKFVVCGPHDGYFQYAIWGPTSADPDDVTVSVSPDRKRLTVSIGEEPGSTTDGEVSRQSAAQVVEAFLNNLREGDLEGAAEQWTGYPEVAPNGLVSERVPFVEELVNDATFAQALASEATTMFVTPSTQVGTGASVVTMLDARSGDDPPTAFAFLVGWSDEPGDRGGMRILRLPLAGGSVQPDLPPGSLVRPGQEVVVPGVPVEGGARGYLNGAEVPVTVDREHMTMSFVVPQIEGDTAVTLAVDTPEVPDVRAFAVTVRG
jgi:hypothetical protein